MLWFNKSSLDDEKGLTLVEVLASLVLLCLITTSVLAIFTPASAWVAQARSQTDACNYARGILDTMRSNRSLVTARTFDGKDIWPDTPYTSMDAIVQVSPAELNGLFYVAVRVDYNGNSLTMRTALRGN